MAKIILKFDFDEVVYDEGEPVQYELASLTKSFDGMSEEDVHELGEMWAQSDFYTVGINNAIVKLLMANKAQLTAEEIEKMY